MSEERRKFISEYVLNKASASTNIVSGDSNGYTTVTGLSPEQEVSRAIAVANLLEQYDEQDWIKDE